MAAAAAFSFLSYNRKKVAQLRSHAQGARARSLTRRYDFENLLQPGAAPWTLTRGMYWGTGARARSRAGWAEWKRIRPCKLAGLLSLVAHSSPLDSLTQARTYVRVYHFRARALQIYHPAREKRRKAIFVLLGLCSRRCSGQGWFHLHSSKFSLSSRCNWNGSSTDKHSFNFCTTKVIRVKATFFFM